MGSSYSQLAAEEPDLRMVLLGKTGVGKSATGNTILGRQAFKSEISSSTVTSKCQKETGIFEDQKLAVIDTPGFFNTTTTTEDVKTELANCISLAGPGLHVFLAVVQVGRFTEEDKGTVNMIQQKFGEKAADYTMALFTHGDVLEVEKCSINKIINGNPDLRNFLSQCKGGYHVFNNRNKDPSQVTELLKKINTMVQKNEGTYYTTKMFQEAEREAEPTFRMVLLGKTGVGKSAAGNTIIGEKVFQSKASPSSLTSECEKQMRTRYGKNLAVVDTPGLFDTVRKLEDVKAELARCISFVAPGPHVFLVVIQPNRFTKEEEETVKIIQNVFGKNAVYYTMTLFTYGDNLEADGVTIKEFIGENKTLSEFVKQCEGRYHVFNNRSNDRSQVTELLGKIDTMVKKNEGRCYTNENFLKAERAINEEKKRLLQENPNMTPQEARRRAERKNKFLKAFLGSAGATAVLGAAAGVGVEVGIGAGVGAIGGPAGAAVGAAVGLAVGAITLAVKKKANSNK